MDISLIILSYIPFCSNGLFGLSAVLPNNSGTALVFLSTLAFGLVALSLILLFYKKFISFMGISNYE